jgi:leader peptidase (prepilin peptidase)/N-methyltransferase
MHSAAILVLIFIFGLLIGSFLNVCIYRIPLEKTVVKGRSYCTACNALIPWYCNIPLFSYLFLKGRCKDCGEKISPVYPIVELLNALLYLAVWFLLGPTLQALFVAILFSILIIIAFIDLKHQIIPDGLVLIILILGIVHGLYMVFAQGIPWYSYVIGFFAASLPLFILALIYPDGMGGGDIKLMAAAGLFTGWKLILLSLFIGAIYGGIVSIFILAGKKGSMKTAIPFGPMLSLGIVTCILIGEKILFWYLNLFI